MNARPVHPARAASFIVAWLPAFAPFHALPAHAAPQTIQVVSAATGAPQPHVAVSVQPRGAEARAAPGTFADMAQRNKAFEPTLLVVQTGTAVRFPNFDTVRHHVYSFSKARTFEIKLYTGTPSQPVVFDKPGTATLGCNIHDGMLAFVHVVDTPHFGVTDAQGRVTLNLPAGEHRVRVWAPSMGEAQAGVEQPFKAGVEPAVVRVSF